MKANRLFIKTKNKKIEYMQDKILELLFYIFRIFPVQKRKIVVSCFKSLKLRFRPIHIKPRLSVIDAYRWFTLPLLPIVTYFYVHTLLVLCYTVCEVIDYE